MKVKTTIELDGNTVCPITNESHELYIGIADLLNRFYGKAVSLPQDCTFVLRWKNYEDNDAPWKGAKEIKEAHLIFE